MRAHIEGLDRQLKRYLFDRPPPPRVDMGGTPLGTGIGHTGCEQDAHHTLQSQQQSSWAKQMTGASVVTVAAVGEALKQCSGGNSTRRSATPAQVAGLFKFMAMSCHGTEPIMRRACGIVHDLNPKADAKLIKKLV